MKLNDLVNQVVKYAYKVMSEYGVEVGEQTIKIKITKDNLGYFNYTVSHFYNGPTQASTHTSSYSNFNSEKDALLYAIRQIKAFYREEDEGHFWIENKDY